MSFKPIHRNLQHVPRIWGVGYGKLFAALFSALGTMLITFFTLGGAVALPAGTVVGAAGFGAGFYLDSRDPLENRSGAAFIRDHLTTAALSNQCLRISEHDHL